MADFDKPCGIFKGPATKGQVVTFTCGEKGVTGRFLFLLKHSPDKLQINELEVIGHKGMYYSECTCAVLFVKICF